MRTMRILHKWLGLIVGVQLLVWTLSGLVFALLDHHQVTAQHSIRKSPKPVLGAETRLREPDDWLGAYEGAALRDISLVPLAGDWIYRVRLTDRTELRRAEDGSPMKVDATLASRLAEDLYAGAGRLRRIDLQTETLEARDAEGPVWRATFDDADATSLYFSAADGRLVAARNDTWRLFDIFWMLHTMDYQGRDNFNNPLVILVATGALWLGISGGLLLFRSFRPGELNLVARWRKQRSGASP